MKIDYSTIFDMDYRLTAAIVLAAMILWALGERALRPKLWRRISLVLLPAAVYLVLHFTVLHRVPSDEHRFVFAMPVTSHDFLREMVMNALLFFPLGLCLGSVAGAWSVPAAFLLSICIELWQYGTGSGMAQVTDILMNTLGCAVGLLPHFLSRRRSG